MMMKVLLVVLMLLMHARVRAQSQPQGPIMAINTYCTLTIPQWISSSGCSTFESSIDLLDFRGNLLGTLTLYGGIGQQFFVNVSNSTSPSMAVYATFPTDNNFNVVIYYSYGILQLTSVTQGWPYITTTFAYAIPPWGLQIYGIRTGSSTSLTSSSWTLNGCDSSTMLDIEPYVPSATSMQQLPCLVHLQSMPALTTPFSTGGIAYVTVYPSMSAACSLYILFDIVVSGVLIHSITISDEVGGNQTIRWNDNLMYSGPPFIFKYQPTVVWLATGISEYLFVGVNKHSLDPLTSFIVPDTFISLYSPSTLYARTYTADATISGVDWVPLLQPCNANLTPSFSDIGQGITFNYIFANNHSSSLCNSDASGVVLRGSEVVNYNNNLWISLPSPTTAIIHLECPGCLPNILPPLTCIWSTPLESQSYVTYGCAGNGCFNIYVTIGVYMVYNNATAIYVPLCNVTILNADLGEVTWNALGSSINNPQIIPYPLSPTYPPTVTITISGRGSNSSDSNETQRGVRYQRE